MLGIIEIISDVRYFYKLKKFFFFLVRDILVIFFNFYKNIFGGIELRFMI